MESHEKFRDKFKIKFDLVADVKKKRLKHTKFGVKKNSWVENLWDLLEVLFY